MDKLTLEAKKRDVLGKKVGVLRRQGVIPTHLFGHNLESLSLQCDTAQLSQIIAHAGMTRLVNLKIAGDKDAKSVFIKEIQWDVLGKNLLHVDFYQVRQDEKMAVEIPIVLVGEAPAMKGKGRMLSHGITSLHIACLPEDVPPQIEVDISSLENIDQIIQVKDIVLNPRITIEADPDQLVVKVSEAQMKEVVEEAVEGEGAPEGEAEGAAAEKEAGGKPADESGAEKG